jgi:hypothetical protein
MSLQAKVALVVVVGHLCLFISGVTADSLLCHFDKAGSGPFDFDKSLLGVFLSLASPFHAQETQLLAFPLLGLGHKVS